MRAPSPPLSRTSLASKWNVRQWYLDNKKRQITDLLYANMCNPTTTNFDLHKIAIKLAVKRMLNGRGVDRTNMGAWISVWVYINFGSISMHHFLASIIGTNSFGG